MTVAAPSGASVRGTQRSNMPGRGQDAACLLLLTSLAAVAVLTLSPAGTGWAWGAPVEELRWYAALSDDARTQLLGNLLLLVPSAGAAALLWPRLTAQPVLTHAALSAGATIELLQWSLPLGRVVSPIDAVLNAAGAVTAARLVVWALGGLAQHERRRALLAKREHRQLAAR